MRTINHPPREHYKSCSRACVCFWPTADSDPFFSPLLPIPLVLFVYFFRPFFSVQSWCCSLAARRHGNTFVATLFTLASQFFACRPPVQQQNRNLPGPLPTAAAAGNMIRIFGYQHQTAVAVVIVNLCFYFLLLVSGNIQHITPNSDSSQTDIKFDTCQFSIQFLNAHAIHFNYNIVSHLYDFLFRPTF